MEKRIKTKAVNKIREKRPKAQGSAKSAERGGFEQRKMSGKAKIL